MSHSVTRAVTRGIVAGVLLLPATLLARPFRTLVTFEKVNGAIPFFSSLTVGKDGAIYGTTAAGGASNNGIAFRLALAHGEAKLATLHSFDGGANAFPEAGLVADAAGMLYGTTIGSERHPGTNGTIFRLDPSSGEVTVLHKFVGGHDGIGPNTQLLLDGHGAAYGTTYGGGGRGYGTIFKIGLTGDDFTVIHRFKYYDGSSPSGLVFDREGALWGTTSDGGPNVAGEIFKLDPATQALTVEYAFNHSNGYFSTAALTPGPDGTFYGTTQTGGLLRRCFDPHQTTPGCGVVFRFDPKTGGFYTVHFFTGHGKGARPSAPVIVGDDGLLYGTTANGGKQDGCQTVDQPPGCGTVFSLDPANGTFKILHRFSGQADGDTPYGPVTFTRRGTLLGTTSFGGDTKLCRAPYHLSGCGTVFEIRP